METKYIDQTNNFNNPWTWIGRVIRFLVGVAVLFLVDLSELQNGSQILWFGYFFLVVFAVTSILWPTDELALDKDTLYFIRKSLLPDLNRTTHYKIADLKGIGIYNIATATGIFGLISPVWSVNRIEIIFKDNSSTSSDMTISKKEAEKILLKVRAMVGVTR